MRMLAVMFLAAGSLLVSAAGAGEPSQEVEKVIDAIKARRAEKEAARAQQAAQNGSWHTGKNAGGGSVLRLKGN